MVEFKYVKYLYKDGEVKLFVGDEVEDVLVDGWEELKFLCLNGEEWNLEVLVDEVFVVDVVVEVQKVNCVCQEKLEVCEVKVEFKLVGKK